LAAMSSVSSIYLLTGEPPLPMGTAQTNIAPYQMWQCQDGPIVAGAPNQRIWERFCQALDRADWLNDERYRDNESRNKHRAELLPEIEAAFQSRSREDWMERLAGHEVPAAPILRVDETFLLPQVLARGAAVEMQHTRLGRFARWAARSDWRTQRCAMNPHLN